MGIVYKLTKAYLIVITKMFETYNTKTGEREFFVPVRDSNKHVIGYFERHEMPWDDEHPEIPVFEYWKHRR